MNRMGHKSRFGVLILLLLALALHGAIPAGFMPEQGGHGLMRLAICTGAGHATVLVDADKYAVPSPDSRKGTHQKPAPGDLCPFAQVLAQDTPAPGPLALPVFVFAHVTHADMASPRIADSSLKPWFAQGPPVS